MKLTDLSTIKALCAAHGFSFSKGLGQNFIVNPGICPKIAGAAGIDGTMGVLGCYIKRIELNRNNV